MDSQPIAKDLTGLIVGKVYKLIKKLGSGAFGEIYNASNSNPNSKTGPKEVAIKIEKSDSKHPQLYFEAKLYNYLNSHLSKHGDKGVPKVYTCITEGGYNFMIMDFLGQSLEDLFTAQNRRFSLQTTVLIGIQAIESIEFMHSKQFIHRDIKPDNFLMGQGENSHKVYIVDFGLAKRYISKDGHIPYKEDKSLTGTARYASINTHLGKLGQGIEQSRRDDLESLGYVLMYFLRGQLPWQNLRANNQKEKYERIMEKKLATSTESLCRGHPEEFATYMNYCKNLKFDEKPDYQFLKKLFRDIIVQGQMEMRYIYDWNENDDTPKPQLNFSDLPIENNQQRQSSQPASTENIQKIITNQFNSSMQGQDEKLPALKKTLNTNAQALISQLQQHQLKPSNRKISYGRPITNHGSKNDTSAIQQQIVAIPTNPKTSSVNSIVRVIKHSSMHQNARSIEKARQQLFSQNQLYRTIHAHSHERYNNKNRQLKQMSKQPSLQQSFQ